MTICNNYWRTQFAVFFKVIIELSCCFLYCNNREASQKQNQMTEIGKTRPKSIDYQRKSNQNIDHSLENDQHLTSHQQPQKLLYRNRSLKHFFGEIKGLNVDILHCRLDQCNRKKKNQPLSGRHLDKRCPPNRKEKIGEAVENQYLVIHKSRRTKIIEQKANTKKIEQIQYSNSLRGSKKFETQQNQQNHKACNKGTSFYDPNAYNWRKSLSKDKNGSNLINDSQKKQIYGPKMTNSEYYTTTNSSRKQPSKLQKQQYQLIRKQYKPKLTLSSCSIQGRKDSLLKPRVTKNVFSPRSPKFKQPSPSPNKVLLFTFGHI